MKTLDIALSVGIEFGPWDNYDPGEDCCVIFPQNLDDFAQAVRAAVIDECIAAVEKEKQKNDGYTEQEAEDEHIADLLRRLK
jgi:hypothetical protein